MEKRKNGALTNVLLAIAITFSIISLSVTFTLNFRPLYYFDIHALDIPSLSGMEEEEIRANYDALIDYNSVLSGDSLELPSLPMSETGRIHFEEVKVIFSAIQILLGITLLLSVIGIVCKRRKGEYRFLKTASLMTIGLPIVLGILVAIGWNTFFTVFHKIFFRNDYWLFTAESDPVITILPDSFFLHCALMILLLVILGGALLFLSYGLLTRKGAKANS